MIILSDFIGSIDLVNFMGDDHRICQAARVSLAHDYEPADEVSDSRLIRYLLKNGHWSCFEHCYMTFRVVCPLPIARQWQRHRSWNFNEVSRRYTDENIQIHRPTEWRGQGTTNRQASMGLAPRQFWNSLVYRAATFVARKAYEYMIHNGVSREQARFVLPQGMYTSFYATASLRSILHFIEARTHDGAQHEVAEYARAMAVLVRPQFPLTWMNWQNLKGENNVT